MANAHILVVEDDQNLGNILVEYLTMKGYEAELRRDGEAGLTAIKRNKYDVCILDIMLPKMDGFSLAKSIREIRPEVPFMFLTAKSMKEDTIEGFKLGADDYVNKPFSMEELLLRLQVVLRRTKSAEQGEKTIFEFGQFHFDAVQQLLSTEAETIKLTTKESQLLELLCKNMNKTLDRSLALRMIWRDDTYFNARSMDVYIAKLRKYLKSDESIQILTIHGEGFKLVNLSRKS